MEGFEFEFEEAELRLLLKLLLADLSERVDSMLIFLWRNEKSVEQAFQRKCFSFSVFPVCVRDLNEAAKWSFCEIYIVEDPTSPIGYGLPNGP